MIDHIVIGADDLAASKALYERALAPLGLSVVLEFPGAVGFGAQGKPELWLREGGGREPVHVALRSPDRAKVDAFHAAALEAGGRDLEAVCHQPGRTDRGHANRCR